MESKKETLRKIEEFEDGSFQDQSVYRNYLLIIKGEDDPIKIKVKEDVNRPNNPDCDEVMIQWVYDNYGYKREWESFDLDGIQEVEL